MTNNYWSLVDVSLSSPGWWSIVGTDGFKHCSTPKLGDLRYDMGIGGFHISCSPTVSDPTGGFWRCSGGTVFKNWEEGAKHCKLECRSFLLCQFWQYSRHWVALLIRLFREPGAILGAKDDSLIGSGHSWVKALYIYIYAKIRSDSDDRTASLGNWCDLPRCLRRLPGIH